MGSKENIAMSYSAKKPNHKSSVSEMLLGEACPQDRTSQGPTLDKGWGEGCAHTREQPLPRPMARRRSTRGRHPPPHTRRLYLLSIATQPFLLFTSRQFVSIARTESYFFNTAKIDFLIRNRTTNIIASRSVRLINLALAERCIYWFRSDCGDVFIAGSTLGCTRWCLL